MSSLPDNATIEGLKNYLIDQGIQDVNIMSDEEIVSFASTLLGDEPIEVANSEVRSNISPFPHEVPNESVFVNTESVTRTEENVVLDFPMETGGDNSKSNSDDIDSNKQAMIVDFCGITGAPVDTSRYFLEAMGWNLQEAVSFYIEQNMNENSTSSDISNHPPVRMQSSHTNTSTSILQNDFLGQHQQPPSMINPIFPDLNMFQGIGGIGSGGNRGVGMGNIFSTHHLQHQYYDDDDDDNMLDNHSHDPILPGPPPHPTMYDEDGLRAPDPVRQQVLIGSGGGGRSGRAVGPDMRIALSRAEDPSVQWLFPPPNHLSFPGSLQEARTICKEEKKWLIVNIQQHTIFSSQILNRDTWVNDGVITILRSNFIFWQRGNTSRDGMDYVARYAVTEEELPRIAILDPRTGAEILVILGYIPPEEFAMTVLEFLTDNSVEGLDAPVVRQHTVDRRRLGTKNSTAVQQSVSTSVSAAEEDEDAAESMATDDDDYEYKTDLSASDKSSFKSVTVAAPAPIPVPAPPVKTWDVPEEPGVTDSDTCKISIKLANGKNLVRRFRKTDLVSALFGVAASQVPEAGVEGRPFDICTTFPTKSLSPFEDQTLEDQKLIGSALVMRWL